MKDQFNNAIEFISKQDVSGCITGSVLLDIFPGESQDIDVFLYDEKSFTKMFYTMHFDSLFQILDPLENWKAESFMKKDEKLFSKFGLVTIKFIYNTCIPVNIILKKNCNNIFSVLSSFDLEIICKAYDIKTKQYLDLTNGTTVSKVSSFNSWNPAYSSDEIWEISRVLRQLQRCFKYYKRGYDTDLVVKKYLELIENIDKYESVFNSLNFNERLENIKINTAILKDICKTWLKNHKISDKELKLLEETIKLI